MAKIFGTSDVYRASDCEVVDSWKRVCEKLGIEPSGAINISPMVGLSSWSGRKNCGFGEEPLRSLLEANGVGIKTFVFEVGREISLKYDRQAGSDNSQVKLVDTVQIEVGDGASPVECSKAFHLSRVHFRAIDLTPVAGALSELESQHLLQRQSEINQLAEIRRGFFEDLLGYERKQREAIEQERLALKGEMQQYHKQVNDEYNSKYEEFQNEKKAFDVQRKDFETREPKYVRRKQRDQFVAESKGRRDKFHLSANNGYRMAGVVAGYIVLLVTLFAGGTGILPLFIDSHTVLSQSADASTEFSNALEWIKAGKQSFMMLGFVITAGFFIRWLNKWFRDNADAEFRFIKYSDDFERANWLVEIATEWSEDKKEAIPEYVVEQLSRNLFLDEKVEDVTTSAMDALWKALRGGRLKFGDVELEVGRPNRKKVEGH